MTICARCKKEYEYKKTSGHTKTLCGSCVVGNRRRLLKKMGVELLGGKCSKCGYNKTNRALIFHHNDPTKKQFDISRWGVVGWERLKNELAKCELLCLNCHAEKHDVS
jgi:hypothetical protein